MVDSGKILMYLTSNKDRFRKDYHVIRIGVFGSIARDEQKQGSDIDIVVEFEENTKDLYTIKQQLREEIQSNFKVPVDLCREKYIKPAFKNLILSEVRYA